MPKHMSVVGHGIKLGSYSGALKIGKRYNLEF
jgi:hypothetical protein